MSLRARYLLQLAATAVAAVLDIIVGKFFGSPTWVMAFWMILTLLVAAVFDLAKEVAGERGRSSPHSVSTRIIVPGFLRSPGDYTFWTLLRGVFAAAFAVAGCCTISLAIITARILFRPGGQLGKGSPLDPRVIAFVGNFQTTEATFVLFFGTLVLAVVLKSEFLVPAGVLIACVVNAWEVTIPAAGRLPAAYASQVAQSLGTYNAYLFRVAPLEMPQACLIPLVIGIAACGIVAVFAGAKLRATAGELAATFPGGHPL